MKKSEFIKELKRELCGIPEDDIASSVEYYEEMINDRIDSGMSEEDAVGEIGEPKKIAEKIISEIPISKIVKSRVMSTSKPNALVVALLVLGSPIWISLFVALFAVLLSVYVVMWSLVAVLYAIDLAFISVGVALPIYAIISFVEGNIPLGVISIGIGAFLGGVSILLLPVCKSATVGMANLSRKLFVFIKSLFIKKKVVQ